MRPFLNSPAPKFRRIAKMIAWDLETTEIEEGTPTPKYVTAYNDDLKISEPVDNYDDLTKVLLDLFLIPELKNYKFVAWNSNRFDSRILMNALIDTDFSCIPYAVKGGTLRGMTIQSKNGDRWEFWDGITMLDQNCKLSEFVERFAPQYPKLVRPLQFDNKNPEHIAYAERDSEALYHAMRKAEQILLDLTGRGLHMTIGQSAIKFFESEIPQDKLMWKANNKIENLIRKYAYRGGYCHVDDTYRGPLYQYDLNQAYAAVMRTSPLPCGSSRRVFKYNNKKPGIYIVELSREKPCKIPVYIKTYPDGQPEFVHGISKTKCVLHTIEIETLRKHGWIVSVDHGYIWRDSFTMENMVNRLETLRQSDPDGPNGSIGKLSKALGCNAYGKTTEKITEGKYKISSENPTTKKSKYWPAFPGQADDGLFWVTFDEENNYEKTYHRPQIGSTITAAVRMLVYNAAMKNESAFLKADTDSVAFSEPVEMDLHPTRYGAWKLEHNGEESIIIGKKVYAVKDRSYVAKGIGKISWAEYETWYNTGKSPSKNQLHLQSWKKGIGPESLMYKSQTRLGACNSKNSMLGLVS